MMKQVQINFEDCVCIEVDPARVGGTPVLRETRITVGQLLSQLLELSEPQIMAIAEDMDLKYKDLYNMFHELANALEIKC
jgi:uncharacterized protein (DUF433 family)